MHKHTCAFTHTKIKNKIYNFFLPSSVLMSPQFLSVLPFNAVVSFLSFSIQPQAEVENKAPWGHQCKAW